MKNSHFNRTLQYGVRKKNDVKKCVKNLLPSLFIHWTVVIRIEAFHPKIEFMTNVMLNNMHPLIAMIQDHRTERGPLSESCLNLMDHLVDGIRQN